ncbi:MAG: hypothetical protein HY925_16675 [Elusimicrobia bacterium]|nr:hypothetical protein [Elusimicrobiota bacterium]
MLKVLLDRKAASLYNSVRSLTAWELGRNAAFFIVGFWMLFGLHVGFFRVLAHIHKVELIGPLLVWKLTGMTLLTTFSMVVLSSLIIALTTLFYSFDLPFLMNAPVPSRVVFIEKSIETTFFSSWMILLVLAPYVLALGRVRDLTPGFYLAFASMMPPFVVLAAAFGMAFTLGLMFLFPSSRTRDAIWLMSSCSMGVVYVLLRLSEPEKLARPDMLAVVAEYLNYLQTPTAPWMPSGWMTRALEAVAKGDFGASFWKPFSVLWGSAAAVYAALVLLADRTYAAGYSGAQESGRRHRSQDVSYYKEQEWLAGWPKAAALAVLLWKERKAFFRDVKHWSQIVLILALASVYLFSIQRLPLETPDLKNLVAFLNLGIAGFVISSLGLRFTFPSISTEGRAFWVVKAAPVGVDTLMRAKFLFTLVPMTLLSTALVLMSNHLLLADRFIATLSFVTILAMTFTLCGMGVGFGSIFPKFNIPNIHQLESSAGGFVYMAAALFYIGLTIAFEAWPVQMHFRERFGHPGPWDYLGLALCGACLVVLNVVAFALPWWLGRRHLETYEEK